MEPWHQGLEKQNVVFILGKSDTPNLQDSIELNEFVSATSFHYFVLLYPAACMNVWHVSF